MWQPSRLDDGSGFTRGRSKGSAYNGQSTGDEAGFTEADVEGLLNIPDDSRVELKAGLASQSLISSRAMLLNIVILIGNGAALAAWYAIFRPAWSAQVWPDSPSTLLSSDASASASPSSSAAPPPPSPLQFGATYTAPAVPLPGAMTWHEVFGSHAGGNASKIDFLDKNNLWHMASVLASLGNPVRVPWPPLSTIEFGRLPPLDGPRRRPLIERWGWIPVSHTETMFRGMETAGSLTHLLQTMLGGDVREDLAGRLPFLNHSSDFSAKIRAEDQLEGSNLWMYVTQPSDDGGDASRQFWFLAGRVLVCDDTADLAAYLHVTLDGHLGCLQQDCALELAASEQHGKPIPKAALFMLANQRLAGTVDRITFRYHADTGLEFESLIWELIAVSDGALSRDACPLYGERTRWGRSPDSLHRCDCNEPYFWC